MKKGQIQWFELPTENLERAKTFYETILDIEMQILEFGDFRMALFSDESCSGALVHHQEFYYPSDKGALMYLHVGNEMDAVLEKVNPNGGSIVIPKRLISEERGHMAIIQDTEGNRVGMMGG
ncbi:MAG: VOC family protein [Saprospiraceae bacterium]|nr:VOC family protein [Saprospiraceae bacterium]